MNALVSTCVRVDVHGLRRVTEPSLTLSPVQEEYQMVVTAAMKVLIAALETRAAPHLSAMCRLKWSEIDEIGELELRGPQLLSLAYR